VLCFNQLGNLKIMISAVSTVYQNNKIMKIKILLFNFFFFIGRVLGRPCDPGQVDFRSVPEGVSDVALQDLRLCRCQRISQVI